MQLPVTDRLNLQSFISNQDRYGYWRYLSQKGDPYAKLALGVVTNETLEGYIANQYAAGRAADLGKTLTEQQWWEIGKEIMEADFNARFGGSDTGLLTALHDFPTVANRFGAAVVPVL